MTEKTGGRRESSQGTTGRIQIIVKHKEKEQDEACKPTIQSSISPTSVSPNIAKF